MRSESDRDELVRQTEDTASATEGTGLVSRLEGEESEENLRTLYGVHRAKRPGRMFKKR